MQFIQVRGPEVATKPRGMPDAFGREPISSTGFNKQKNSSTAGIDGCSRLHQSFLQRATSVEDDIGLRRRRMPSMLCFRPRQLLGLRCRVGHRQPSHRGSTSCDLRARVRSKRARSVRCLLIDSAMLPARFDDYIFPRLHIEKMVDLPTLTSILTNYSTVCPQCLSRRSKRPESNSMMKLWRTNQPIARSLRRTRSPISRRSITST